MPRPRRLYYGWWSATERKARLSLYPADAPVRPSLPFDTVSQALEFATRKRAEVMWWPPLPHNLSNPNTSADPNCDEAEMSETSSRY